MSRRKILIITPIAFGYTKYIYESLSKFENVDSSLIYIDNINFRYRNLAHRTKNFLLKTFFKINIKKRYITELINSYDQQDEIFIIRPDLLDDYVLRFTKRKTKKLSAFYFDSIGHFPRKKDIIPFFDSILSFDKTDVKNHGFEFCTNYIFDSCIDYTPEKNTFFNISGHDDDFRFAKLESLARYISRKDWSYKFISVSKRIKESNFLTISKNIIPVEEIKSLLLSSKILVEFQRENQIGLSFRVFEALGYNKKLITTNTDIINYDFYHPQNILVLNPDVLKIPSSFVESPYVEIPEYILAPYRIDNWVKKVFNLK